MWLIGLGLGNATSSTDDGRTWKQSVIEPDCKITSIWFVDDEYGWAAGCEASDSKTLDYSDPAVLQTKDGGKSWTKLNVSSLLTGVWQIAFDDRLHGVAVTANAVYSTTDGGATWKLAFGKPQSPALQVGNQ